MYRAYLDRNEIPRLPADVTEFGDFFAERREALARRITLTLSGTPATMGNTERGDAEAALAASIDEELAESAYAE